MDAATSRILWMQLWGLGLASNAVQPAGRLDRGQFYRGAGIAQGVEHIRRQLAIEGLTLLTVLCGALFAYRGFA